MDPWSEYIKWTNEWSFLADRTQVNVELLVRVVVRLFVRLSRMYYG